MREREKKRRRDRDSFLVFSCLDDHLFFPASLFLFYTTERLLASELLTGYLLCGTLEDSFPRAIFFFHEKKRDKRERETFSDEKEGKKKDGRDDVSAMTCRRDFYYSLFVSRSLIASRPTCSPRKRPESAEFRSVFFFSRLLVEKSKRFKKEKVIKKFLIYASFCCFCFGFAFFHCNQMAEKDDEETSYCFDFLLACWSIKMHWRLIRRAETSVNP